ncbi:MAG: F0F1 ATP synthase subunit epsilon [Minisyncoccota bacterium]
MFQLTITNVQSVLFQGLARAVVCPGSEGELTVLAHHTPLVTTLKAGNVRVKTQDREQVFAVTHGILEVGNNEAVILL